MWAWSFLRSPSDASSCLFRCPFPALSQSFRDLDSLFFGSFSFPFLSGLVFTVSFCRAIKENLFKLILEQEIVLI